MIWFADIEAYSYRYFKKYGDIKGYAFMQKNLDGETIFDVDMENYLDKVFKSEGDEHTIFYHNGGGYDFYFLLAELKKRADKYTTHKFTFFQKDNVIYKMTYTFKKEYLKKDSDGKSISTGKRKNNGKLKYERYRRTKKFVWLDTYRHWPLSLATIGKVVGLKKLDYEEYNIDKIFKTNEDYINWKGGKAYEYLHRDVDILVKFYKKTSNLYSIENDLTLASNSFKEMTAYTPYLKMSREWIKDIEIWKEIKSGFAGGFTWVNPKYQLKKLHNIYKYDVNSLYPYVMRNYPLPYGGPIKKESKEKDRVRYYAVSFKKAVALSIPFMSKDKKSKEMEDAVEKMNGGNLEKNIWFEKEYPEILIDNKNRVMSSTTLDFFRKWYKIKGLKIKFLYEFKTQKGMFDQYIDKWTKVKMENDDNPDVRLIAKLKQNTTFGKFAQGYVLYKGELEKLEKVEKEHKVIHKEKTIWVNGKQAQLMNDGYLNYKVLEEIQLKTKKSYFNGEEEYYDLSYIPLADQITSNARIVMLKSVMENPDLMVYGDTDSIHTTKRIDDKLDIHQTKLGCWKYEGTVGTAVYRRPKHYLNIDIDENGKKTDYLLKGGGFNVRKFNDEKSISVDDYLQENFTVKFGKTVKMSVYGKPIIMDIDYNFNMPKWFKKES